MVRGTAFVWLLVAALGCSISHSSQSSSDSSNTGSESSANSSDSSSNSSTSSSDSSGGDPAPAEQAYRDDVRDYTASVLLAAGGFAGLRLDAFQNGLGAVARRHGIANWEVRSATWRGMGAGFARARASQEQLDRLKQSLAATRPEQQRALQDGYESLL